MSDFITEFDRMLDHWALQAKDRQNRANIRELAKRGGLLVEELERILSRIDRDLHRLRRKGVRQGPILTQPEIVDLALGNARPGHE